MEDVVMALVGDDSLLLRRLLESDLLAGVRLAPLVGRPIGAWFERARAAIDAGFSQQEVVRAAFSGSQELLEDESTYWTEWRNNFEALKAHTDPVVRELGKLGSDEAEARRRLALADEEHERIFGE